MTLVTRKVLSKPSNSKSPGSTHHIEIGGQRFECTAEQRGTGWASASVDDDTATIEVAATFAVGKAGKKERIRTTQKVRVTGDQSDVITLAAEYTSGQALRVEFRGVKDLAE